MELVVVMALLGVLAVLAAPNMSALLTARRLEDAAQRLAGDMALARNEAVKRNAAVLLCPDASITTGQCAPPTATQGWAKGWRVCVDRDNDGACDSGTTSDPNPIRSQGVLNVNLSVNGPLSSLRFNPSGTITATVYTAFEASSSVSPGLLWRVRYAPSGAMSVRKG
jgi:Tfp pilus assembly protein FimT